MSRSRRRKRTSVAAPGRIAATIAPARQPCAWTSGPTAAAPALAPTVEASASQVKASVTVPRATLVAARLLRTVICGATQSPANAAKTNISGTAVAKISGRQVMTISPPSLTTARDGGPRMPGRAPQAIPPSPEPPASAAASGPPSAEEL